MKIHALIEDLHHRADCEDTRHQTSGFSHHQENAAVMRAAAAELTRLLMVVSGAAAAAPPVVADAVVEAPGADEVPT